MAELMKKSAAIASYDAEFMRQAIKEARLGFGLVSPNPLVGAILVRANRIIGKGFHAGTGLPHAEVNAIRSALESGEVCDGTTLYVTLEPCSTFGRTPPCTDLIIRSRISRVVIGSLDPNPKHAGRGIEILQQAGIEVTIPVEEDACRRLNAPFFHWVSCGKPLVVLKLGTTLDGKIATATGESKWITGSAARERVQMLRHAADVILVGSETARRDCPSLTARAADGSVFARTPKRYIASCTMSTAQLLEIYQAEQNLPEVVDLSTEQKWDEFLTDLGQKGMNLLLIEGGGGLAASALNSMIVNLVEYHIAPKILGGVHGRPSVGGVDAELLEQAHKLRFLPVLNAGDDLIIRALVLDAKHQEESDVYWYN